MHHRHRQPFECMMTTEPANGHRERIEVHHVDGKYNEQKISFLRIWI